MIKYLCVLLVLAGAILFSCKSEGDRRKVGKLTQNAIVQQQDGTISLKVDKADTYQDRNNPESNTAEWNVMVSKSGRYNVWISSATKDTTSLRYQNTVMLSVKNDLLEVRPAVDKIISNSTDVSYPYYRADSFMGSLFIQDTGMTSIQVISDKILPGNAVDRAEDTKLLSVSLTPAD